MVGLRFRQKRVKIYLVTGLGLKLAVETALTRSVPGRIRRYLPVVNRSRPRVSWNGGRRTCEDKSNLGR